MMKLVVTILAVLGLTSASSSHKLPSSGSGALAKELQDFLDLLPVDQLIAVTNQYSAKDKQFQVLIELEKSPELKQLISDIEGMPEFQQAVDYLQLAGLDARALLKKINNAVGIKSAVEIDELAELAPGVQGYIDTLAALIPRAKLIHLFNEKVFTSKVFADALRELSLPKYAKIGQAVVTNTNSWKLVQMGNNAGISIHALRIAGPISFIIRVFQ